MICKHFKLLVFLLAPLTAYATSIQVVQSVPIETNLHVPGIATTQQVWLDLIRSAKKTIDLEQFYIHHKTTESLDPVLGALQAAAARGVQIRLIVDIQFFKNYPEVPIQLSKVKNIQVKTVDFSTYGGIQHAKFFVVDQTASFIGSANFDWLALSHIHEVGLQVLDPQISSQLSAVFNQDWMIGTILGLQSSSASRKSLSPQSLQLVGSPTSFLPKEVPSTLSAIISLLGSAKSEVKIQLYQYSLKGVKGKWLVLDQEIRKAATRGVQVKLLVDAVALRNSSAELKALAGTKNIQVKTVTIPPWSGGPLQYARLIHSKYFTVDGERAWVGTENWSESYFTACRNVGLILHSSETTLQLDRIFDQVWNSAYAAAL